MESTTRAFSVFMIEIFIFSENNSLPLEDVLDYYLKDYLSKEPRIRYVSIYSPEGDILVHSDPQQYIHSIKDTLAPKILSAGKAFNRAYENDHYGWILESAYPLRISGKEWGVLRMGFEGESVRNQLRELLFSFLGIALLISSVVLVILYFMSGYLTASLRNFVSTIDQFEIDSPPRFDKPKYDDEIKTLYTHFYRMQQRLKESQNKVMQIQRQIYQAEKLASIGRLASGVAHEINNPLNGIRNCLFRLEKTGSDEEKAREYYQLIDEGILQIESIVKKMLGFARKERQVFEPLIINEQLQKVVALLDYKFSDGKINLELNLAENLPQIKGDPQLLQEVFMNVLLNSLDAVEDKGSIGIISRMDEAGNVRVEIRDDGMGISAEEMEYIYDPFYTTKEPGKGTGLGLSVVRNITEAHGGTVEITSSPGKGTTVTLIFAKDFNDENTAH